MALKILRIDLLNLIDHTNLHGSTIDFMPIQTVDAVVLSFKLKLLSRYPQVTPPPLLSIPTPCGNPWPLHQNNMITGAA
ncbi:hypothetical protein E2542_SST27999 [Spatholobus suberectus]|nr:hypothetical protein E2542_SST27999 [Spatholobus suberectus]